MEDKTILEVTLNQRGLRVAVLSDIHGNIRALNAVLEEVERDQPDRIVVCGDVAAGPFPGDTLERLMELGARAYFVRGNADMRFTFFITSKIAVYLDKTSRDQKLPKSVYLRNLIEEDMKRRS